jgi:bifunctional enzyme CysN/CysC
MGHAPMIPGRRYKMKLGSMQVPVELVETESVLDASDLTSIQGKKQIDRHDVGVCLLETARPAAFDISSELEKTARFVIVDNFEIAGCGIVLEGAEEESRLLDRRVRQREAAWRKGYILPAERAAQYQHNGKCIIFIGAPEVGTEELAKKLELKLFLEGAHTYYLSLANVFDELALGHGETLTREEHLQQLGEMARIMTDAGLLFITALNGVDVFDMEKLKLLNAPNELFVIRLGKTLLSDFPLQVTLPSNPNVNDAIREIVQILNTRGILPEYTI